jgi:predicted tellurium resistance membrane protein TerC
MFAELLSVENLISLLTLTVMEIVLGIDNVVFISILCGKLPDEFQAKARKIGIGLAFVARVGLLISISWLVGMTIPLFTFNDIEFSGRDIILIGGGLFLLYKSTIEIHTKVEHEDEFEDQPKKITLRSAIIQIVLIDLVFSFDSILTAVGLVNKIPIMVLAVLISMFLMFVYSKHISDFIENNPTVKMLALSFLLMIGMMLVLEGFDQHVPKGYIYFAMSFSLFVEWLNIRSKKKRALIRLERIQKAKQWEEESTKKSYLFWMGSSLPFK